MLKTDLLADLKNEDIPDYEIDYITSVVAYLDKQMSVPTDEIATFSNQEKKMINLVSKIKQGKTGVDIIDQIQQKRKDVAIDQIGYLAETIDCTSTQPYIMDYISTIADNGGLFKYVSEGEFKIVQVNLENNRDELSMVKTKKQVQADLLDDLKTEDVPDYEREYITSVVAYLDKQMSVPTDEIATFSNQEKKMINLVSKIKQGKTGVDIIDQIQQKRKDVAIDQIGYLAETIDCTSTQPYIINYISTIADNGGLFKYVSEHPLITSKSALENALKSGTTLDKVSEAICMENNRMDLGKNDEGVTKDD